MALDQIMKQNARALENCRKAMQEPVVARVKALLTQLRKRYEIDELHMGDGEAKLYGGCVYTLEEYDEPEDINYLLDWVRHRSVHYTPKGMTKLIEKQLTELDAIIDYVYANELLEEFTVTLPKLSVRSRQCK